MLCCHRIAKRRDAVVEKRQNVKALSAERAKQLSDSMAWQEFCREADEVWKKKNKTIDANAITYAVG